jgi:hypothetical protein
VFQKIFLVNNYRKIGRIRIWIRIQDTDPNLEKNLTDPEQYLKPLETFPFMCPFEQNDPEERRDISEHNEDKVEMLKDRIMEHFENLIPRFADPDDNVS